MREFINKGFWERKKGRRDYGKGRKLLRRNSLSLIPTAAGRSGGERSEAAQSEALKRNLGEKSKGGEITPD